MGDMNGRRTIQLLAGLLLAAVLAGCGTSGSSAPSPSAGPGTSSPSSTTPGSGPASSGGSGAGALVPEAQAVAAGDIPDNQVFLTFGDRAAGYSMKYPEGWAQHGSGRDVTFQDKNNLVHIVVEPGPATLAGARADLRQLAASTPSFTASAPVANPTCTDMGVTERLPMVSVGVVYVTHSKPNPVTGKRVKLSVNRYYLAKGTNRAIVDLGTPQGVDNVDAYCLMIRSFRWM